MSRPLGSHSATILQGWAESLRERQKALGLTVRDIRRITGASHDSITAVLKGDPRCKLTTVRVIARALGFDVALTFTPIPEPADNPA